MNLKNSIKKWKEERLLKKTMKNWQKIKKKKKKN